MLAPVLQGNVDFGDLLVFEMISIRFPSIRALISHAPRIFTGKPSSEDFESAKYKGFRSYYRTDHSEKTSALSETKRPKDPHELLKDLDEKEGAAAEALLEYLFPDIIANSGLISTGSTDPDDSGIRLRAGTPLLMLLAAGPVDGLPSPEDIQSILKDPEERKKLGRTILNDKNWFEWILSLMGKISDLNPNTAEGFIDWVTDQTKKHSQIRSKLREA